MRRNGRRLTGYPALVDESAGVSLTLLDTRDAAVAATRLGVIRLIGFELGDTLATLVKSAARMDDDRIAAARRRRRSMRCRTICGERSPIVRSSATIRCRASAHAFVAQVKRARTRFPPWPTRACAARRDRGRASGADAAYRGVAAGASHARRGGARATRRARLSGIRRAHAMGAACSPAPISAGAVAAPATLSAESRSRPAPRARRSRMVGVAIASARKRSGARAASRRSSTRFGGCSKSCACRCSRRSCARPIPVSFKRVEKAWQRLVAEGDLRVRGWHTMTRPC